MASDLLARVVLGVLESLRPGDPVVTIAVSRAGVRVEWGDLTDSEDAK